MEALLPLTFIPLETIILKYFIVKLDALQMHEFH